MLNKNKSNYRRYFQIGGITIQVESPIRIKDSTFHPKFKHFEVGGPGKDTITIQHYFSIPSLKKFNLENEVYKKAPWAIYKNDDSWIYLGILSKKWFRRVPLFKIAVFNHDYTHARIYNKWSFSYRRGNLSSLTIFPTDQILLAQVLSNRHGCIMHSAGVEMDGKGLLFVGHSDAGKSTIVSLLKNISRILCDDRIIIRKWGDIFKIHGTWSHGDVAEVSSEPAPLHSIMFLEQASENCLIPLNDKKHIIEKLLACLIKPFVTTHWWDNMFTLIEQISCEIPCYTLKFKNDDSVLNLLHQL